jgi:hypothetical protein
MVIALLPAECGAHAIIIATRSLPKAKAASGSLKTSSRKGWGVYVGTAGLLSLSPFAARMTRTRASDSTMSVHRAPLG